MNDDNTLPACRALGRQHGFTLIEVLIALIVLVLGVLGASAMMLTALRDNKQAAIRSQATALAYELGEMIRMNTDPSAAATFLGGTPAASASCYAGGCSLAVLASSDYADWLAKINDSRSGLPGATVNICRDQAKLSSMANCDNLATSPIVVKFKWLEKSNNGSTGALVATANPDLPSLVVTLTNY